MWVLLSAVGCGGAVFNSEPEIDGGAAGSGGAGSGSAGAGSGQTGGSSSGGSGGGVGGAAGAPGECPMAQPANGTTCVNEGQDCPYTSTSCSFCSCMYHCWNRRWVQDGSGCVDPPPPPPIEDCPVNRPQDGMYCASAPLDGCKYVASYCREEPNGWTTYSCLANIWRTGQSTVNPCTPNPNCPTQKPMTSTACAFPLLRDTATAYCYYRCPGDAGLESFACVASRWSAGNAGCSGSSPDANFIDEPRFDGNSDASIVDARPSNGEGN